MAFYDTYLQRLHKFATTTPENASKSERAFRHTLAVGWHCAQELRHDRAGTMAAALTYHTLFSLLPTLVLMLVVVQAFVGDQELESLKQSTVDYALQWLETETSSPPIDPQAPEAGHGSPADQAAQATAALEARTEYDEARQALADNIQYYIDRLREVNFRSIGIVGVLLFIYGATALLATIEQSFNRIYAADSSRPLYLRLPLYYTVITLGPLVLLAGQVAQARLFSLVEAGAWTNWLAGPLVIVTPVIATWVVLTLLYVLLPNTYVSWKSAIVGALVAGVGWVVGIELFRAYVGGAAAANLYGALALLPLFLLWLYLTWLIVLFGLEVTYTLHHYQSQKLKSTAGREDDGPPLVTVSQVVSMMSRIANRFTEGNMADQPELVRLTNLSPRTVRRLIERLEASQLVRQVPRKDGEESGIVLARPAQQIGIDQLLEAIDHMADPSAEYRNADWHSRLRQVREDAFAKMTLADVEASNK